MPLVKIDVIRGAWSTNELRLIADVIQQVMMTHFNAPKRDRYQVRWEYIAREYVLLTSHLDHYPARRL